MEELAKAYAPEAVKELFAIGTDPSVTASARVSALNAIIERGRDKSEGNANYTLIINQINRVLTDVTPESH